LNNALNNEHGNFGEPVSWEPVRTCFVKFYFPNNSAM